MKPKTLQYIERCATEYDNASVQKLSCKDVRDLLFERDSLLEALEAAYAYPQVGGAWPSWMTLAKAALDLAKEEI